MRLLIDKFAGMVPLIESSKLPINNADLAINCRFDSGSLQSYGGLKSITEMSWFGDFTNPVVLVTVPKTIFLYRESNWFSWVSEVYPINSPINNDPYDRVYYTGESVPRMTANTVATGTGTMPAISYRMGVKQPNPPVIASYSNNPQNREGQDDDITRFYVLTYVNEFGEESMPSLLSGEATILNPNALRLNPDAAVNLDLPGVGTNDQNITQQRIYRTNISGDAYQLVVTIPIANTAYSDSLPESQLGPVLQTWTFAEPIQSMDGLISMANGIAAGFTGNTICFSEAYLPHAWPVEYQQTTQDEIVAIVAVGNGAVVSTKGKPYLFSGVSPDAISGQQIELAQACTSARSMVDMGEYAIYASPDGLVAIGASTAKVITAGLFNKKEWAAYSPYNISAAYYEEKYIAFYSAYKGFIFDPRNGDFIELDFTATALYNDLKSDSLYMVKDGGLKVFDYIQTPLSYTWSKVIRLDQRASPSCAYVDTPNPENIAIVISVDGQEIINYPSLAGSLNQVPGTSPVFRLPAIRGYECSITVTGTADIHQLAFGTNMKEVQHGR